MARPDYRWADEALIFGDGGKTDEHIAFTDQTILSPSIQLGTAHKILYMTIAASRSQDYSLQCRQSRCHCHCRRCPTGNPPKHRCYHRYHPIDVHFLDWDLSSARTLPRRRRSLLRAATHPMKTHRVLARAFWTMRRRSRTSVGWCSSSHPT